jgi:hypothetical protein
MQERLLVQYREEEEAVTLFCHPSSLQFSSKTKNLANFTGFNGNRTVSWRACL